MNSQEFLKKLNTSIIRSKEKVAFNDVRVQKLCNSATAVAISHGIKFLAKELGISEEEAIIEMVKLIRNLKNAWTDYILLEGLHNLKTSLRQNH